jgi:hypothetical protein
MSELSQTEWRSDHIAPHKIFKKKSVEWMMDPVQRKKKRKERRGNEGHTRTRGSSVPVYLVTVPAAIAPAKVQRLMHVAGEMDQKLERLLRQRGSIRRRLGQGPADEMGEDGADVVDGVEDVRAFFAGPAVRAREAAVVRWVVTRAVDEVQRGGPARVHADLVRPCGDRREVARRRGGTRGPRWSAVAITVGAEDGADGFEDFRLEV